MMEWNVFYYNSNTKQIETYNVLAGAEPIIKKLKKSCETKQKFSDFLRREIMYRFWSKSEWEIILSAWCGGDGKEAKKIDAYSQALLNWDRLVDYCWEFCNWKKSKSTLAGG